MAEFEVIAEVSFKTTIEAENAVEAARIAGDTLRRYTNHGIMVTRIDATKVRDRPPIGES